MHSGHKGVQITVRYYVRIEVDNSLSSYTQMSYTETHKEHFWGLYPMHVTVRRDFCQRYNEIIIILFYYFLFVYLLLKEHSYLLTLRVSSF